MSSPDATPESIAGVARGPAEAAAPGTGTPRGARHGRAPRLVLAALLLASFAFRIAIVARPIEFLDDLAIPDDAYLSLTIARNLANGMGPLYGLAPTNGFQPLYVFLMAPVFALFPGDPETPIRVALVMLSLFDTAALYLLFRLVARSSASPVTPFLVALAWAVHPYAILTALNGLETSIAFFFLVAILLALARLLDRPDPLSGIRAPLGIGILLGLAALARIDSLLMAPVIAAVFLTRSGGARARGLASCAVTAGVALLVYLPWLAYSWASTHDLFPVSGRALRHLALSSVEHRPTFENLYRPMLERALGVVARRSAPYWAILVPLALGLLVLRPPDLGREVRRRLVALAPALAFAALLFAAYTLVVFGPWHFPRYFFPITLVPVLLFGALADLWLSNLPAGRARAGCAALLAALVIAGSVAQPAFRRMVAPRFEGTWGYRRIGLWARGHFAPGDTVGGSQTGALGYFADRLTVVNLDGVVNRDCYEAMRQGRMLDYMRRVGVRDLVWQDDIEMIARESRATRPAAVTRAGRIEGFETWGAPWYLYRLEEP